MIRRRRLRLAYLLGSLLLLAASLHAPTAYSAAGDPPSGSPAGAVYQLPLEQGRSDAAPKGSGGTGIGTGGGGGAGSAASGNTTEPGESDSLYRTENDFGSSSHVPGVASTGGGGPGGGSGSGTPAGGGSAAGNAAIGGGAVAAETADTGNTSVTAGIVLIAAIALLAAAIGVLSRRLGGAKAI